MYVYSRHCSAARSAVQRFVPHEGKQPAIIWAGWRGPNWQAFHTWALGFLIQLTPPNPEDSELPRDSQDQRVDPDERDGGHDVDRPYRDKTIIGALHP